MSELLVQIAKAGTAMTFTLNRPKALNAISLNSVRSLTAHLTELRADATLSCFILKGAGEKAFCAGGDIKTIYEQGRRGERENQMAFFREEYQLDYQLASFNKRLPQISIWDGAVMGGGVGLSIHSQYRIATERSVFAMPETAIGFIPDVSGSWFLPRLPQKVGGASMGLYLALTGARLDGRDLAQTGLATHFIPSTSLPALEIKLSQCETQDDVRGAVEASAQEPGSGQFNDADIADIESLFSHSSVSAILAACNEAASTGSRIGAYGLSALPRMSPTALVATLEQMRRGSALHSLADAYRMELRVCSALLQGHDFSEGVRALLIEKDNKPVWKPASIAKAEEKMEQIRAMFDKSSNDTALDLPTD